NHNQLQELPPELGELYNLRGLDLNHNQLQELPPELGELYNLERLDLSHNQLQELPPKLGELYNLERLDLNHNQLQELPPELGELEKLEYLHIEHNRLHKLPDYLEKLRRLRYLDLDHNQLKELPPQLKELLSLRRLSVNCNQLTSLSVAWNQLYRLRWLSCNHNNLQELPPKFGELKSLITLDLSHNSLNELPADFEKLQNLDWLDLHDNRLENLPDELGSLKSLKKLNLNRNNLKELPVRLEGLRNLSGLYLNHNQLQELPNGLGEIKSLRVLDLSCNKLTKLPEAFGELKYLYRLNLSYNQFNEIPNWLRNSNLYLLHIQGNRLNINKPYLHDFQIKSYFETRDSVNESYALAESTLHKIKKSSNSNIKDSLVEIINRAKELYKSISETVEELVTDPNPLISRGFQYLNSYATSYILSHVIVSDFLWAYLEKLADGGFDKKRAKQEVDYLKKTDPNATPKKFCDDLVYQNFLVATAVETSETFETSEDLIRYNFLGVTALLEKLVFQIGYYYGFENFNWLEDIIIFAIVYNTQRLKRLGLNWIESITPTSKVSQLCIDGFANFVMFQAIGYTAKFYYELKTKGVKGREFISRYKELEQSGGGLKALVEQHINQKAEVEQTLEMTVNATRDIWSYKAEQKLSEPEKPQPRTPINRDFTKPKEEPKTSRLEESSDRQPEFIKIVVVPEIIEININESCSFKAFGIDLDGNKIELKQEQVEWDCAEEGTIDTDGNFLAKKSCDSIEVTAKVDRLIGKAKVKAKIPNTPVVKSNFQEDKKDNKPNNNNTQKTTTKLDASSNDDEKSSLRSFFRHPVVLVIFVVILICFFRF
ncbi:MAG: leucine-rich repeat domain-containing protein, partial [Phormidium sp. BM_Day4_Bin.17]|nr:leucine-rich repeat domain-containing protein [Phormidium sp. BM_Day4_Bin.17]